MRRAKAPVAPSGSNAATGRCGRSSTTRTLGPCGWIGFRDTHLSYKPQRMRAVRTRKSAPLCPSNRGCEWKAQRVCGFRWLQPPKPGLRVDFSIGKPGLCADVFHPRTSACWTGPELAFGSTRNPGLVNFRDSEALRFTMKTRKAPVSGAFVFGKPKGFRLEDSQG